MNNYMNLEIPSRTSNEAFARAAVGAFAAQLDLTVEEMADIKTAVSEAVTNSIIHGYPNGGGTVKIHCETVLGAGERFEVVITDTGCGIKDIQKAMQPLYTTAADDERSGMGFTVMQSFMDSLEVSSEAGKGTEVKMIKNIGSAKGVGSDDE